MISLFKLISDSLNKYVIETTTFLFAIGESLNHMINVNLCKVECIVYEKNERDNL